MLFGMYGGTTSLEVTCIYHGNVNGQDKHNNTGVSLEWWRDKLAKVETDRQTMMTETERMNELRVT